MAKYIVPSVVGSFVLAFACDHIIADKKIFGGTTPSTVSNKECGWRSTRSSRHGFVLLVHQLS
ncbi:hypothetical protein LguiA_024595 [Lonicera macranthoides]